MHPVRPLRMLGAAFCAVVLVSCGAEDAHLERMAEAHAADRGDVPGAAAASGTSRVEVSTAAVVYARLEGGPVRGYFASPLAGADAGAEAAPGVIVIHEWWGLNENVRAMTRKLAAAGYAALAVDLYEGEVTAEPAAARALAGRAGARPEALEANLRQAHAWLARERGTPRVGVIGWCFGGGWSLRTALLLPEAIDATVIYYGRLISDPERLRTLRGPVLGLFGELDRGIPVAEVHAFEQALERARVPHQVHIYPGADHAFANPSGTRHEPEAAADAWRRTLAFLAEQLRP